MKTAGIGNIGMGVIPELFDHELKKVLKNIQDDNTPAKTTREITINLKIIPTDTREMCVVKVSSKAKLAPVKAYQTSLELVSDGSNNVQAYVNERPEQQNELNILTMEEAGND